MNQSLKSWQKFLIVGIGVTVVVALALVTVAVLSSTNKPAENRVAAVASTVPVVAPVETTAIPATPAATDTPVATPTALPIVPPTAVVVVEATTMPDNQPAPSSNTSPKAAQPPTITPKPFSNPTTEVAKPAIETTNPTTVLPATTPQRKTVSPAIINGQVTSFDSGAGLITLVFQIDETMVIKIGPATVVTNAGTPAKTSEITVGSTISANGIINAQGILEASSIAIVKIRLVKPQS